MIDQVQNKLIKKHTLDIGTVYFYENLVISEIKEGVFVNFDKLSGIFELGKMYYGNKTPFVYLSHRINSYSLDPMGHLRCVALFPNLKGYGAIIYNDINFKVAELEQKFIVDKTAQIFDNVDDALRWAENLVPKD